MDYVGSTPTISTNKNMEITRTNTTETTDEKTTPESSIPIIEDFKGKPVIVLNPGSKWPFSMGLGKAKLILPNVRFIQAFVDSGGTAVE